MEVASETSSGAPYTASGERWMPRAL